MWFPLFQSHIIYGMLFGTNSASNDSLALRHIRFVHFVCNAGCDAIHFVLHLVFARTFHFCNSKRVHLKLLPLQQRPEEKSERRPYQ